MSTLIDHLARWKPFTAIVVGDFMLDQLVFGDAERLSADAPVPVLRVRRREHRPGGAANVCLNLAALKGTVHALGVAGDDEAGRLLRRSLADAGVDADALHPDPSRPTTLKQSLVGLAQHRHPQKMFRVDEESTEPIWAPIVEAILGDLDRLLPEADVVCIEDYAKGVCCPPVCRGVIERCRAAGVPVLVDPAQIDDYARYRGASAITPNRSEAELAVGARAARSPSPADLARSLLGDLDLEAVVVTLDRDGALLLEGGGEPIDVPTVVREVYDVTGAGDVVVAALAAARANALTWPDAVRLANAAAGLEVEVFGVEPIPLQRLHHAVLVAQGALDGKVRTLEQLAVEVDLRRAQGQRIVFTNGCFDVLHAGHVWLLDRARDEGDFLIVATNTDETIRRYKGPNRPVNTAEARVRVLAGLASVDAVLVFEQDTPAQVIQRLRPDVLVKGDEYSLDQIPGAAFVQSSGGRVVRIPMMGGQSTSKTLDRLGDPRAGVRRDAAIADTFVRDRAD